jgi:hypothetical protein
MAGISAEQAVQHSVQCALRGCHGPAERPSLAVTTSFGRHATSTWSPCGRMAAHHTVQEAGLAEVDHAHQRTGHAAFGRREPARPRPLGRPAPARAGCANGAAASTPGAAPVLYCLPRRFAESWQRAASTRPWLSVDKYAAVEQAPAKVGCSDRSSAGRLLHACGVCVHGHVLMRLALAQMLVQLVGKTSSDACCWSRPGAPLRRAAARAQRVPASRPKAAPGPAPAASARLQRTPGPRGLPLRHRRAQPRAGVFMPSALSLPGSLQGFASSRCWRAMATKASNPARKASATSGSKCLRAAGRHDLASLVIAHRRLVHARRDQASNTSAMAIRRAETGMASPARPSG